MIWILVLALVVAAAIAFKLQGDDYEGRLNYCAGLIETFRKAKESVEAENRQLRLDNKRLRRMAARRRRVPMRAAPAALLLAIKVDVNNKAGG